MNMNELEEDWFGVDEIEEEQKSPWEELNEDMEEDISISEQNLN